MVRSKRAKTATAVATTPGSKTTSPAKKSTEKTSEPVEPAQDSPVPSSPPPQRKRRMASLNAEFFVRYSSSSYKNQTPTKTAPKKKNTETPELNASNASDSKKRKRTAASPASAPSIVSTTENTKPKLNSSKVIKSAKAAGKAKQPVKSPKKVLPKTTTATTPKATKGTKQASKTNEKLNATCPIELITTGRPKRDASARASAMIIQTSEFEKVRHYSKKDEEQVESTSNENEKAKLSPVAQKKEPLKKTISSAALAAAEAAETSTVTSKPIRVQALKKASKVTKKALTKKSKPAAKSSPEQPLNVVKKILTGDKLTEDMIKEHNNRNGSLSRGNGSSFSNSTKMYIVKWTMENVPSIERPFEEKIIPIESFGEKILDQPQYLKNKKAKPPNPIKQQPTEDKKDDVKSKEKASIVVDKKASNETTKHSTKEVSNSTEQVTKIKQENTTTTNNNIKKDPHTKSEQSSSMSDSVHLVVDETPAEQPTEPPAEAPLETPEIINDNTPKTVDSLSDANQGQLDTKKTQSTSALAAVAIPSAAINAKETTTSDKNKAAENAENFSSKADKAAPELAKEISPIKPKSVLNIVTDNIEPVQVLNDIKANVLSELMNESSNTNYSMED